MFGTARFRQVFLRSFRIWKYFETIVVISSDFPRKKVWFFFLNVSYGNRIKNNQRVFLTFRFGFAEELFDPLERSRSFQLIFHTLLDSIVFSSHVVKLLLYRKYVMFTMLSNLMHVYNMPLLFNAAQYFKVKLILIRTCFSLKDCCTSCRVFHVSTKFSTSLMVKTLFLKSWMISSSSSWGVDNIWLLPKIQKKKRYTWDCPLGFYY